MRRALTIAGSDPSGGAGIQADLKTMTALGVYGMSAITALTAQNTMGVTGIHEVPGKFLKLQLKAVFTDIVPHAVKIGMVSSRELILEIGGVLKQFQAQNIVLDPVMVSTSGSRLLEASAQAALTQELFPLACLVTPNRWEASLLAEQAIDSEGDMAEAAKRIYECFGTPVLVKGGHSVSTASDVLYDGHRLTWFHGDQISNPNTHGTGCTLSSAIASGLALGCDLPGAIALGKHFIIGALEAGLDLGHGSGPLHHGWNLEQRMIL